MTNNLVLDVLCMVVLAYIITRIVTPIVHALTLSFAVKHGDMSLHGNKEEGLILVRYLETQDKGKRKAQAYVILEMKKIINTSRNYNKLVVDRLTIEVHSSKRGE